VKQDLRNEDDNMLIYFLRKYLRFSASSDRMPACQSLLVATDPEWKGGYQWQ